MTIRSLDHFYGYEPGRYLAVITPTPLLMVVGVTMGSPVAHRHRVHIGIAGRETLVHNTSSRGPLRRHVSADVRLIEVARHASRTVLWSYDAVSNSVFASAGMDHAATQVPS